MNLYERLGVAVSATKKEIKKAFLSLSKKHHPDKGGDVEVFKEVQAAYQVLYHEDSRKHYDSTGSSKKPDRADLLLAAFMLIINDKDFNGNIIEEIKESLLREIAQCKVKAMVLETDNGLLSKQLGRITTEGEENLFELMLLGKVEDNKSRIELIETTIKDLDEVFLRVDKYKDTRPEIIIQPHYDNSFGSMGALGGIRPNFT